jgi:polysaccharide biosynthesis protein PelF
MRPEPDALYRGIIDPLTTRHWGKPDTDLSPDGKTICLILEGAYPYISGGVSSWVQQLATRMKEYRFKILTIMASDEEEMKVRYKFPDNVIEFRTIFLFEYLNLKQERFRKRILLTDEERGQLRKFILFDTTVDWRIITNLICRPDKIGNTIDFLMSYDFFDELQILYDKKYDGEGFNIFFWTFRSMLATLICVMQQKMPKADLYHAISTGYAGLMGLIGRFTYNKPFLLTEHGIYAREREEEILKADWVQGVYKQLWIEYFYFLSVGAYKSADKVISLFPHNREIQVSLGVPREKALVIPNGVDDSGFPKHKEPHAGINVAAILRVVPIKDVKTLIRAFNFVVRSHPEAHLLMIGPSDENKEYAQECRNLIDDLGLNDSITFTGQVNIKEYLPKIDMIVLTSISEAQPLVILEAYASAIPVIATDVGSCRDLVEGIDDDFGPGGIITRPVSPKETAHAIIALCKDPALRVAMGESGLARTRKYYGSSMVFRTYSRIYEQILDDEIF